MKRLINLTRITIIIVILCAACALAGCRADISAYAGEEIEIIGLLEEPFVVTPGELAEMKCMEGTAVGESQKAGTVKAYGPTLQTFVENYGHSLDEFSMVRVSAADDYEALLGPASWDNYDVILSIASGSNPLAEYEQPLRIVIPGGNSGNWVRMTVKMEFVRK